MAKKPTQRFATTALMVVTIWLVVFSVAQMVIFTITGNEQTQLIESTFAVIGLEVGGLLVKRIADKIFGRNDND